MKKYLLALLLIIGLVLPVPGQSRYKDMNICDFGGFRFTANEVSSEHRSSLQLFNVPQKFPKDSLVLTCQMTLSGNFVFGHLLTCKSEDKEIFNVILSQSFTQQRTLDLNLNLPFDKKKIKISIPESICREHMWYDFKIAIYPRRQEAVICYREVSRSVKLSKEGVQALKKPKVNYTFGVCEHYVDLIPFSIKNLSYTADKKVIHYPLTETEGQYVHDDKGKVIGTAVNPNWLYRTHFNWTEVMNYEENEIAAVCYNPIRHLVHIFTSGQVVTYDIKSGKSSIRTHKDKETFRIQDGAGYNYWYNFKKEQLFIWNNASPVKDGRQIAVYDNIRDKTSFKGNSWATSRYYHSSTFVGDDDSCFVYQFGGYGEFRYSNEFYKIDMRTGKSRKMEYTGDHITPRFYSSVYPDVTHEKEDIYIFGGYGNESGIQGDGGNYMSDLYKLDLKTGKIELICDFGIKEMTQAPCRNLIMGEDGHSFYTLCYPHHEADCTAKLYCFDWKTKQTYTMTEGIRFVSKEIPTRINLFQDKATQSLIAVIQAFDSLDKAHIKICRLSTPLMPVSHANLLNEMHEEQKAKDKTMVLVSIIAASLLLLVFIVLVLLKFRKKTRANAVVPVAPVEIPEETAAELSDAVAKVVDQPVSNSIYLLGDFTVFDRNSKDITYLFSSKIRQLFILILMNSIRDSTRGISSNEISSILWPEKELTKSKNIRAVTMKNLRDALSGLDGIQVIYDAGKWTTEIDYEVCHCDFIKVAEPENSSEQPSEYAEIRPYIRMLRRGALLKTEEFDWMDIFKSEFEDKILTLYGKMMKKAYENGDFLTSYKIAQVLLTIDTLNKDLMKVEINSLIHLGDSVKAVVKFRQFALNYFEVYKENLKFEDYTEA